MKEEVKVGLTRNGFREPEITVFADPTDPSDMRRAVAAHLEGKGWDPRLIAEFRMIWLGSVTPHEMSVG